MPALPTYRRFWDAVSLTWRDLPEKKTPIIGQSLDHWDGWIGRLRDRVEEIAGNLGNVDAAKADKTTTISAGTGLVGGGTLAANRTLNVKYGATAGTATEGNDARVVNALAKPVSGAVKAGDLLVGLATGLLDRFPIGTNGTALLADSTAPLGLRWGTPPVDGSLTWSEWTSIALNPNITVPSGGIPPACRIRGSEVQLRGQFICSSNGYFVKVGTVPAAVKPVRKMAAFAGWTSSLSDSNQAQSGYISIMSTGDIYVIVNYSNPATVLLQSCSYLIDG